MRESKKSEGGGFKAPPDRIGLKDNQYFYVCLFWGKAKWDIYVPYACKSNFFILNVYCYK